MSNQPCSPNDQGHRLVVGPTRRGKSWVTRPQQLPVAPDPRDPDEDQESP